ncbi:MAG: FHA domain-containing protein [Candidatus Wallbacteria bacterium]|nr:FHA domain-containing protein [Candidatus Wallbacteria bacterium]
MLSGAGVAGARPTRPALQAASNIRYLDRAFHEPVREDSSVIKLIVVNRDSEATEFRIKDRVTTIGRSSDNHMVLPGSHVSRNHATIERTVKGFVLTDLGSKNGTLVNNKVVKTAVLSVGDKVKIGENFLFVDNAQADRENAMDYLLEKLEDSEKKFLQAGIEFLKIERKDVFLKEVAKAAFEVSLIAIPLIVVAGFFMGLIKFRDISQALVNLLKSVTGES